LTPKSFGAEMLQIHTEVCMDEFQRELMRRSPLAGSVLEISDFIFDDQLLHSIYSQHRGRCYEDTLGFGDFLRLMRDALIRHGGSGHKLFVKLELDDAHPVDESNFYRKLARTPVAVSRALLRECTGRLAELMPAPAATLPACFDNFQVLAGDGKKIKNAAKRLKLTRGYSGKLLGAKALVAVNLRSGLAIAMSDSLDGQTNDVPLVPELMEQLHQMIACPILSIWDRQFDDVRTLGRLSARAGDAFVVRMNQSHTTWVLESSVQSIDAQGRRVLDEIGLLGKGKLAMRVRRVKLFREAGEEDVELLTNLMERWTFAAADLLELYRRRWGIEQVFQQVTETFSLSHLIGSAPKAVLLQFSYCLLLYNLMQVIKTYVAEDGGVLAAVVSMNYLFSDVREELQAWAYHAGDVAWPRQRRDGAGMRQRLDELLEGVWNPKAYTKASDKKPRGKPREKLRLHGGHTSVQRLLEGKVKLVGHA
jgi:DDE family transposase